MKVLRHITLLWLGFFALQCHADTLLVVVPAQSALTEEFVFALERARTDDEVVVHSLEDPAAPEVKPQLIITMGVASLEWRLRSTDKTPTLATYVSRSGLGSAELDAAAIPSHIRFLLSDPKPVRQLRLARLLMPRLRTAGLLYSPALSDQLTHWQSAAEAAEIKLNTAELGDITDLARTLVSLLDRSDVLIGTDDPRIYNADNLKTILLTSYTRNRVLIGPSAPFIAAGSLSTTFSSPAEMALSVNYLLDSRGMTLVTSYPRFFSVLSNQQVARSMGFAPPDDAELAAELARMEGIE